ncbi:YIEGIA domain-containing protein [Paraclostridium bifermentans]|uniref:Spore envelope protein n=1 Tax=Paraclostridium bifermentans TaxID=1490 RepID=A0A5P3XI15_PARBF|nr:YIEGIA domain-containing protein [Paraclostridium bifermentans]QEZ69922.1 spore envelope protein [Paraclostridium bifermentans]TQO58600.1 spore envelope protein [Paraclostridium bifermentans]GKZ03022.1 spore envelope protein [Paraclostridium bifermentans]GKZ06968.1 spore envelope protein [Paraclostridium bifermentans]GKZ11735.1 spore envelope protein [Paraclostridium bifermentans]
MKSIFIIGIVIGIISRVITLKTDRKQYPTEPNMLVSQLVLAIIGSALGAMLVPALIQKSYTSITFLSLAASQFRQVRHSKRKSLTDMEDDLLVKRGSGFIEEIALTYEVRSYTCILTALTTSAVYHLSKTELYVGEGGSVFLGAAAGLALALIFKKLFVRESIGAIAEVIPAKISFDGPLLKVNDVVISNIGLDSSKQRYLDYGLAVEIIPKDGNYINSGIILSPGQRQTIANIVYSRLGIMRTPDEPDFIPLLRRNPKNESLVMPYIPIEKDINQLIAAVKSTPIIESSRGNNWALKRFNIKQQKGV